MNNISETSGSWVRSNQYQYHTEFLLYLWYTPILSSILYQSSRYSTPWNHQCLCLHDTISCLNRGILAGLPAYFSDYLWQGSVLPKRFRTNTVVRSHGPMGIFEYSTTRANTTGEVRGCLFDRPENTTLTRYETSVLGLTQQGVYSSMLSQGNKSRFLVHANGTSILLTRAESDDGSQVMNHGSDTLGDLNMTEEMEFKVYDGI